MIASKAAVSRAANAPLSIETVMVRPPAEGEVLIELKVAGLCHTDLHAIEGNSRAVRWPMVLGHEGAGVVAEVGPGVDEFRAGDHVLPFAMPECGHCDLCTDGRPHNFCEQFPSMFGGARTGFGDGMAAFVSLGTFSQYITVPAWSLAKVRPDAPLDLISTVSCGVATGVGAVLFTAKVERGASVVVFGLGGVGLSAVQGARMAGATTIIGVDVAADKEAAGRSYGMTHFVNPREVDNVVESIQGITGGGADYSFDCVGNIALLRQAFDCLRTSYGVCTAVGLVGGELTIPAPMLLMGKRLIGTTMGGARPKEDLPRLVDYFMDGQLDLETLVSDRLPFDLINHGFDLMREGKTRRTIVTF
ncbi:alcohol dehydrogenase catalytic domain-containing protein [Sphingomonas sp.]|uniref:alcohol dehydrogenase catalytic domain-containing protein n=1 Tax=Sphingomonas sp. TaxID=28214 RepID=UPI002CDC6DB2|nr:zinc-binding dehydrogenase [Sphingomonas sp.]HWK35430.1 zinc-binding dehydrogenase [Sphingomonas sp.]